MSLSFEDQNIIKKCHHDNTNQCTDYTVEHIQDLP